MQKVATITQNSYAEELAQIKEQRRQAQEKAAQNQRKHEEGVKKKQVLIEQITEAMKKLNELMLAKQTAIAKLYNTRGC